MSFDKKLLKPFLDSTISVFEDVLEVTPKEVSIEEGLKSIESRGLVVVIGITEGGKGRVVLDMNQEMAMKISEIINEDSYNDITSEVFFTISEIANMISGNGITEINNENRGLNLRLTPPSIFFGDEVVIDTPNANSFEAVYETNIGIFNLNVAFEKSL